MEIKMRVRDPWINKDIAPYIIAKLNRIEEAKQCCEAGDVNACVVLGELLNGLTEAQDE